MAVRIADTLKQQNNLTTFPVAYGEDIWLDENKGSGTANYDTLQNLYNDGKLGGSSIQVETMPVASADYLGNIVQFVGETGSYKKGHFYECIHNVTNVNYSYEWQELDHFRFNHTIYSMTTEPINNNFTAGDVIYYTGKNTENFKANHFYRALPNATPQTVYQVNMKETAIVGVMYDCNTPFELRVGFIVFPSVEGGESTPYQITEITDEGITLTPYGWSGDERNYIGASYSTTVLGWEELEGGGGTSIFYGTMEEWNALSTDAKKQYDYMSNEQTSGNYTDIYSTSEVKTNKVWIDGKPIYRRILTISANVEVGTTETNISGKLVETPADIISWGIDNVIFLQKTGNFSEGLGIVLNVSTGIITAVSLKSSSYWLGAGFHIMVEYTKTTD